MNRISALVVDDSREIQDLLKVWLQARGHDVRCVGSEQEGRDACAESDFDVVIADIVMPDGSGLKLIEALRKTKHRARILAISGGGPRLNRVSALQSAYTIGADALLVKPFTEEQFWSAVTGMLARAELPAN